MSALNLNELADRCEAVNPEVIRFSVTTIPGKKGLSWGQVATTDELSARLLCDLWNNRLAIAAALRGLAATPSLTQASQAFWEAATNEHERKHAERNP